METKPRILYLQKILLERTDEENPLSTTQLINILNDEYGISAHRTTAVSYTHLYKHIYYCSTQDGCESSQVTEESKMKYEAYHPLI